MAKKTQEEINYWFQDITIKSALDLSLIEKVLHNNNLDIPNNVIINKNGNTYDDFAYWYCNETKISKYPTTFDECVALLQLQDSIVSARRGYEWRLISYFQQLLLCRDAYWKIAGEKLGLDGHWEPDWEASIWNDNTQKYCILVLKNKIELGEVFNKNTILAFPTAEMRDAFYENFKYLIVVCKTLL